MKKRTQSDLRYIKTEKLIQETFRDMIKEMDYTQISIKDLTERAMINRKTFYLHYSSLDELLGKMQTDIYAGILDATADLELPRDLEKMIRELFAFSTHLDDISEKILNSQGSFPMGKSPNDYVIKTMYHCSLPEGSPSNYNALENNIIDAYLGHSLMSIYAQWMADEQKIPLEKLIKLTLQLVSHGLDMLHLPE